MITGKYSCFKAMWACGLCWLMVVALDEDQAEKIARAVIGLSSPYGRFMGEISLVPVSLLSDALISLTDSPEALIQR